MLYEILDRRKSPKNKDGIPRYSRKEAVEVSRLFKFKYPEDDYIQEICFDISNFIFWGKYNEYRKYCSFEIERMFIYWKKKYINREEGK